MILDGALERTNQGIRAAAALRLCDYLRHHPPVAQIGYSIVVFELNDDEINRALYGPPAELMGEVCVLGF